MPCRHREHASRAHPGVALSFLDACFCARLCAMRGFPIGIPGDPVALGYSPLLHGRRVNHLDYASAKRSRSVSQEQHRAPVFNLIDAC